MEQWIGLRVFDHVFCQNYREVENKSAHLTFFRLLLIQAELQERVLEPVPAERTRGRVDSAQVVKERQTSITA